MAKITLGLKGTLFSDWTWNSYYEWAARRKASSTAATTTRSSCSKR
ncbi:MAG: hypothetical protein WDM81_14470 [Rhizomicrobium sp.]